MSRKTNLDADQISKLEALHRAAKFLENELRATLKDNSKLSIEDSLSNMDYVIHDLQDAIEWAKEYPSEDDEEDENGNEVAENNYNPLD